MLRKAVLLMNLGTPDHFDPASVKRYLKEFLSDPRVIDISSAMRWLLVNGIILPSRHKKSAAAYEKIWQEAGSPLLIHTQMLAEKLALHLGSDYHVAFGMRYGSPSIGSALQKLLALSPQSLHVIPLFPQYASASTGSALEVFFKLIATEWNIPEVKVINSFYANPGYIHAYKQIIEQHIKNKNIEMLIFSYHGLPQRHIKKSQCVAACDYVNACPAISDANSYCYRAQCYTTSRLIAESLGLDENQYHVAFQSRLGRTPWVKPYTDVLLPKLAKKRVKNIAVVCPSFVADCLETLEEVNIRMREQWQTLGGGEFVFIPCLNDHPIWVNALMSMVR